MPEAEKVPVITSQQIRDRVAVIEKVRESWKGVPEYADTISMEIWALKVAADLLEVAQKVVDGTGGSDRLTEDSRRRCAMALCELWPEKFKHHG